MFRDFCQRAFNSMEIIAVTILLAVITTSLVFSGTAEPDQIIKEHSLGYSHLVTSQQPR